MTKLIHIRSPRLRIGKTGLHLTKPTARIGGKTGINLSSHGVSASIRTKHGTISTRRGLTIGKRRKSAGCLTLALILIAAIILLLTTN